jgi:hypothetical protein
MYRIFIILLAGLIPLTMTGQTKTEDSILLQSDSSTVLSDTLKSFMVKKEPPFLYKFELNHQEKPFFNKMVRGNNYAMGYNAFIITFLLVVPEAISKWDKENDLNFPAIGRQYHDSYTKPPVIDHDMFITNYIGHPYQGGFYYNTVRSQGATILQSSLFCLGQSLLWEYGWEAGLEQPSIQDLITTPLAGILVGELCHVATLKMSRHGFTKWEKVAVCIINPAFAFNNKLIFKKKSYPYK